MIGKMGHPRAFAADIFFQDSLLDFADLKLPNSTALTYVVYSKIYINICYRILSDVDSLKSVAPDVT